MARSFVMAASPVKNRRVTPQVRFNSSRLSAGAIKSSLWVIKRAERRPDGELVPPQVLPGRFAQNENERINADQRKQV